MHTGRKVGSRAGGRAGRQVRRQAGRYAGRMKTRGRDIRKQASCHISRKVDGLAVDEVMAVNA